MSCSDAGSRVTPKSEVLLRLKVRRDAFVSVLAAIPEPLFLRAETIGRWSVRDLLAHLVAHEQRALAELAAARRGQHLAIDHTCTNEFNAGAGFAWAPLGRHEALTAWDDSYRAVVAAVDELTEVDFMPGSALEHALGDTVDGALANNTYAHYAEHLPGLEALARMSVASDKGGRWPPPAEELVARIRAAIQEAAGSALAGLYLVGSLVVGDFDVDVSDIDLIAVLTSDPSDGLVVRLGRMHDALASENPLWAGRIEVIYVSAVALSRWWEGIARLAVNSPGEPFHVVEGGPDWVLSWYPARESAITLFGPPVETFIPPISREAFEAAVRQHLRLFPSRVRDGDSLPAQAYAILTMCRGLYTLSVGDQPSKVVAAAWAQREFPEWAPLIRSALAWRKGGVAAGDRGASEIQRFVAEIARRVDA